MKSLIDGVISNGIESTIDIKLRANVVCRPGWCSVGKLSVHHWFIAINLYDVIARLVGDWLWNAG